MNSSFSSKSVLQIIEYKYIVNAVTYTCKFRPHTHMSICAFACLKSYSTVLLELIYFILISVIAGLKADF